MREARRTLLSLVLKFASNLPSLEIIMLRYEQYEVVVGGVTFMSKLIGEIGEKMDWIEKPSLTSKTGTEESWQVESWQVEAWPF